MKTPRHGMVGVFAAMILVGGSAISASAQIVRLCGSVTEITGIYLEDFPIGCPTVVEIDLSPPLEDLLPDAPEWGIYWGRPIHLKVDGRVCPVDIWPHTVNVLNRVGGWMSGLLVSAAWTEIEPTYVVSLGLVGETDLISSDSFLPGGIPMESSADRRGYYYGPEGSIGWSIDAYEVLPAPVAVPEPAAYGLVGALGLGALAYRRRYVQTPRG